MAIDPRYLTLRARIDAFFEGVVTRQGEAMACRAGCDGCCQSGLGVGPTERAAVEAGLDALPDVAREALRTRARGPEGDACVMLRDGRCAIYESRPLVCRSQGLPLLYPAEFVPEEAVRGSAGDRALAWCPLNFAGVAPTGDDVLDAERVDLTLAAIDHANAASPEEANARVSLRALAAD